MNNLNLHSIKKIEFNTRELLGENTTFVKNLRVTNNKGESFCISLFSEDLTSLEFVKEKS